MPDDTAYTFYEKIMKNIIQPRQFLQLTPTNMCYKVIYNTLLQIGCRLRAVKSARYLIYLQICLHWSLFEVVYTRIVLLKERALFLPSRNNESLCIFSCHSKSNFIYTTFRNYTSVVFKKQIVMHIRYVGSISHFLSL